MSKRRWINLFLALSLVMVFVFATHSSTMAAAVLARPEALSRQDAQTAAGPCYLTTVEIHSVHLVSLNDQNMRILETDDGPLGYDGGLTALAWCR